MEMLFSHLDAKEIVALIIGSSLGTVLLTKTADWLTDVVLGKVPASVGSVVGYVYDAVKDGKVSKEELKDAIDKL